MSPARRDFTWKGVSLGGMSYEQLLAASADMARIIAEITGAYKILPEVKASSPVMHTPQDACSIAKLKGYVGEACPDCMNFTLVRNGTCLKCDTCGSTTGCS